jgi:hypothetical protein
MTSIARRTLLRALALAATVASPRLAPAATVTDPRPTLDENEPAAKAIAYVADARKIDKAVHPTYRRGQSCTTCAFIDYGTAPQRGCSLVPGKLVYAAGWCKVWKLRGTK